MAIENQPSAIPNYVSAASPQGLRRLMLKNNARLGAWVQYFDIQQSIVGAKTVWIAWFYEPVETDAQLNEILQGGKE